MSKVLFMPFGLGLAHTGRLIMIARQLQNRGIEVVFGAGGDAVSIVQKENLPFFTLPEFDRSVYERKVKKNNFFIYNRKIIHDFVNAELHLYDLVKPDVVIYDTRVTAKISANIAKIPIVSITNVDVTPFYDLSNGKAPVRTTVLKYLPQKLHSLIRREYSQKFLRKLFPLAMEAFFTIELIRLSPSILRLGYRPSRDPFQLFFGDLTLLTDIPEYRPIKKLPRNVKLVGPIFWNGGIRKLPDWKKKINKKIIYVTAGGTGDKDLFIKILSFLRYTKYIIVATTGNTLKPSEVKISYPNLYLTDYLPGNWIMPKAKLVIFTGGNSTAYQALSFGVPQICVPIHVDQEDNANHLERLGTGLIVNPYVSFNKEMFLSKVTEVLGEQKYNLNAQKMKKILSKYNGAKQAAEEIINFLK